MKNLLAYFENNWLSNVNLWNVFRCDTCTNNIYEDRIKDSNQILFSSFL